MYLCTAHWLNDVSLVEPATDLNSRIKLVNVLSWNSTLKYYQIIHLCKVLLSIQPVASKKETSIWYKITQICIRKEVMLCSLFFVLCSLFFVLCSSLLLERMIKGQQYYHHFQKFQEFVLWLNTPILIFINQMKMCWFVVFWRMKKIRKKPNQIR